MNTEQATQVEPVEEPVVVVTDLDQFIAMLQAWHGKQVATMEHMKLIPPGTVVTPDDEAPFTLDGDVLRAFQMGISISLSHLGELPFSAEFAPDASAVH